MEVMTGTDVPFAVLQFLVDNPWIVWVWIGATLAAVGLRAAYPETEERPRWLKALLAIVDVLQLNLSGPVKLARSSKGMSAPTPTGEPKP